MSFASRHNKGAINWGIDASKFEYVSREKLYNESPEAIRVIRGLYINKKGKYGDHPVGILENCFVDLPAHLTDEVNDILKNFEDVEDIKAGKVGIQFEKYESNGRECIGVKWIDM